MTRLRNLGPMLAAAGACVAAIAVVAGFIVVGGPGHARDQRLDETTRWRASTLLQVVQCAFDATGLAPLNFDAAKNTPPLPNQPSFAAPTCEAAVISDVNFKVEDGLTPALGNVSYKADTTNRISVCATYRTASDDHILEARGQADPLYLSLDSRHPAGTHCYEIDLVKSLIPGAPAP